MNVFKIVSAYTELLSPVIDWNDNRSSTATHQSCVSVVVWEETGGLVV